MVPRPLPGVGLLPGAAAVLLYAVYPDDGLRRPRLEQPRPRPLPLHAGALSPAKRRRMGVATYGATGGYSVMAITLPSRISKPMPSSS